MPHRVAWIIFAVLLLFGGAVLMFRWQTARTASSQIILADGTVLTLEAITSGKTHHFRHGNRWFIWAAKLMPRSSSLAQQLAGGTYETTSASTRDALGLWITRFHPATGAYSNADWGKIEAIDSHGCRFVDYRKTGFSNGRFNVAHTALDSFPRYEPEIKLRFFDRTGLTMGEFTVKNPAPTRSTSWTPEPLPLARTNGAFVCTLKRLRSHPTEMGNAIVADISAREGGDRASNWIVENWTVRDAHGNESAYGLCTNDAAWKLTARMFRDKIGPFLAEETWTVTNMPAPPPGTFVKLDIIREMNGLPVKVIGVGGVGHFTISNNVLIASTPGANGNTTGFSIYSGNTYTNFILTIGRVVPFVLLERIGDSTYEKVFINTTDANEGDIKKPFAYGASAKPSRSAGRFSNRYRLFDLESAQPGINFRLDVIVHPARTVEFTVAPAKVESAK